MNLPKKGVYRHFKGNRYELLGIAKHSETMEPMVVYRALYGEGEMWVRPLSMWSEWVECEGRKVPRFTPEEDMELSFPEPAVSEPSEPAQPQPEDLPPKIRILRRYFGYDAFREGQEEVVDAILSGRDTLAVMPTGAGKSICYQVPALVMNRVALVISPLISLMKDQVQSLIQSGIPAAYLNSSLTERQFDLALSNAVRGKYRIIYVAPERLLTPRFQAAAAVMQISLVAVDEAHCISQWGQDFRPSYLTIPEFLQALPERPVVCAFTATATQRVREDIHRLLEMHDPHVCITGFDRKNLYYSVSEPPAKDAALLKLLAAYKGLPGIVYCATRKKVEAVYELLIHHGYSAARYHAGLSDAERQTSQDDFIYDRRDVMVATNAFGMGIDKSNVRFVIHYNMPGDVESYYQEAGRAGRDGERADCHLLFGRQDILTQKYFIDHMGEEAGLEGDALRTVQERALKRLNAMVRYCQTPDCLRGYILSYFGESAPKNCGFCLNCLNPPKMEDRSAEAQAALRCVEQAGERFGRSVIVDLLRGAETERIRQFRLDRLLNYGALRHISRDQVSRLLDRLEEMGALRVETLETPTGQFPILHLGDAADAILAGDEQVNLLSRPQKKQRKKAEDMPLSIDRDLFARLTALRKRIAVSRGVPPYVVFPDSVLRLMADRKPRTMEDMAGISGIGVVKLREFGAIFLKEVQKYESENS